MKGGQQRNGNTRGRIGDPRGNKEDNNRYPNRRTDNHGKGKDGDMAKEGEI